MDTGNISRKCARVMTPALVAQVVRFLPRHPETPARYAPVSHMSWKELTS